MAESTRKPVPSKKQMRSNWSGAMARANGGAREDKAVDKMVSSPAQPPTDQERGTTDRQLKTRHYNRAGSGPGLANPREAAEKARPIVVKKSSGADVKTYQKHVLFAIVTAFVLQLIANGKSLPQVGK
jgi:hypothetical protein